MYRNNRYDFSKMTVTDGTIIGAATEPITLQQAKNWLRLDHTDDDARITSLITTARQRAEKYLRRDILPKTREVFWTVLTEDVNLPYTVDMITSVTVNGQALTENAGYELLGTGNAIFRVDALPAEKVTVQYSTPRYDDTQVTNGVLMLIEEMYEGTSTAWKFTLSPFKVFGYYGIK